ncbi:hypothetical protein GCM10007425_20140 [Lysinibacillus alkalisoli]|uniref:DUF1850 domain-containing protein n=1 Tax=Lysinibacillus alkalisoli TaxID=1911548 RepID=A0A917LI01_9BACI|nr:DUF1850 domain-containing protein [Lysinibacillus alkalisoli]GGG25512.1 hypothetical protein GCM10007425_20140 [Lysinibacillus alkalisoli]
MHKRYKIGILALLLICSLVLLINMPWQTVIVFQETNQEKAPLYFIELQEPRIFYIRYTHSIHRTDVFEYFDITPDQQIKMTEMIYENMSIGMPSAAEQGQRLERKGDRYHLYFDKPTLLASFVIYIGDIDLDLAVHHKKEYDLKHNLQRGHAYECRVDKLSLYQLWKGVQMR